MKKYPLISTLNAETILQMSLPESAFKADWAQKFCRGKIFLVGANENLKNVKCIALDKEFFANPEIVIGDLSKNDEEVCRFMLSKDTTQPLRFEVWYNGKVKREVCDWQHYSQYVD